MSTATRVKLIIARQGLSIAIVLGLVGLGAIAGAGWVYTHPQTKTVTEQANVQQIGSQIRTSAVVTGNSTLYDRGERLVDMPVYFLQATPDLTIRVVTSTPDGVATRVTQRLRLVQVASRDGRPFFRTNRTLIDQTGRVSDGRMASSTRVNVTGVQQAAAGVQEEIGGIGTYQIRLELSVSYRTDRYEGTLEATTPLTFTSRAYWLPASLSDQRQHSRTVSRQVTSRPDPVVYAGLGILGVVSLAGTFAIVWYRRGIDMDISERELSHQEYDEWISSGEFPTGTDKRYVSVATLEDLVDIAIDSEKRVIYDPSIEVYSVVDSDLVYYFSENQFNVEVWLDT